MSGSYSTNRTVRISLYEDSSVQHDRAMQSRPVEVGRAASGADDGVRTDWLTRKIVRLTADLETAQGEAMLRTCYSAWAQMPREQSAAISKDQSFTSMSTKWGSDLSLNTFSVSTQCGSDLSPRASRRCSDLSIRTSRGFYEDLAPREEHTVVPLEGAAKSVVPASDEGAWYLCEN